MVVVLKSCNPGEIHLQSVFDCIFRLQKFIRVVFISEKIFFCVCAKIQVILSHYSITVNISYMLLY